jgi:hypothetical protein
MDYREEVCVEGVERLHYCSLSERELREMHPCRGMVYTIGLVKHYPGWPA